MACAKRGDSGLSLIFAVNKPRDYTSHDIVNLVRKATGERRVGHGGTLDPFATGVLPIMVGSATRLSSYFDICKKEYIAKIEFGKSTDTDDVCGEVIEQKNVPDELFDERFAKSILDNFVGEIEQVPPKYSAIKVGGKKSYEMARKGKELKIPKRKVKVFKAELLEIEKNPEDNLPVWEVRFIVGSGTYIRSIARDAGVLAKNCAFCLSLTRTQVGGLAIANSVEVNDLQEQENFNELAIDPSKVISIPLVKVDSKEERFVSCGGAIDVKDRAVDLYNLEDKRVFVATNDKILGIYKFDENIEKLKADTVFYKGILR